MTAQLSRERLEEISESSSTLITVAEAIVMARMLLAGMDSVPVAWTDEQELQDLEKSGCAYLFTVNPITPNADPRRVIRLYTAPPAPVAVDEIAEQAGINPAIADAYMQGYHDSEARKTAPVAVPDEKWVNPDIGYADENGFAEGWNACRAAMLNAGPVTEATWIDEAKKLAEMHGTSFVVFRNGEEPQCADPSKVVISFTDKGLGYPAAPEQEA